VTVQVTSVALRIGSQGEVVGGGLVLGCGTALGSLEP
jgi:hypothetical protein